MRFLGGIGITLISMAAFPVWSGRQLLLSLGIGLVCVCFDSLIDRAGRNRNG